MRTLLMVAIVALTIADGPPNLTGTWNMGLQGGQVIPVALVLRSTGTLGL